MKLMGVSWQETMKTPIAVIYRHMEFNNSEEQIREMQENAKSKQR